MEKWHKSIQGAIIEYTEKTRIIHNSFSANTKKKSAQYAVLYIYLKHSFT